MQIFVVVPDYDYEGYGEPIDAYDDYDYACQVARDRMKGSKYSRFEVCEVELFKNRKLQPCQPKKK